MTIRNRALLTLAGMTIGAALIVTSAVAAATVAPTAILMLFGAVIVAAALSADRTRAGARH